MANKKYELDPALAEHFKVKEKENGLPPGTLEAVAHTESAFNPNAVSPVGAKGMFQFMPATAQEYKVDVSDPYSSADGAARMLGRSLKRTGDLPKTLAEYNWGSGNVQKKGMENAPTETRNYIQRITKRMGVTPTEASTNTSTSVQKKNLAAEDFPPAMWEAFDKLEAIKENAKTKKEVLPQTEKVDGFTPEQWAAFDALEASNAPVQTAAPVAAPAPTVPQQEPGLPIVNKPVMPVQGSPLNPQNVMASQAASLNLQPAEEPEFDLAYTPTKAVIRNANPVVKQEIFNKFAAIKDDATMIKEYSKANPVQQILIRESLEEFGNKHPELKGGVFDNFLKGLGREGKNFKDTNEQAILFSRGKLTGDMTAYEAKTQEIRDRKTLEELQDAANPSYMKTAGGVVASAAMGLVGAPMKAATTIGGKLAQYGMMGAGGALVSNPSTSSADNYLSDKAKDAAIGAGTGVVAGSVLNAVGKGINKVFNETLSSADQKAIKEAKDIGINLQAGDLPSAPKQLVTRNQKEASRLEAVGDKAAANQDAAETAAKKLITDIPAFDKTKYIEKKGLTEAATDSKHYYHSQAKDLESRLATVADNDGDAILKITAEAQLLSNKIKNNSQYEKAGKLAPSDKLLPIVEGKQALKEVKKHFDTSTDTKLQEKFKPTLTSIKEKFDKDSVDFITADRMFKDLGELARQAKKDGDEVGARFLNNAKSAISKDQADYVDSLPNNAALKEYKEAYAEARSFNEKNIQSVKKDKDLNSLANYSNKLGNVNLSDKAIENAIKPGSKEKAQKLFDFIDEDGKNAVRQGVLNKVVESAQLSKGFTPQAFIDAIKKYESKTTGQTPLSVVFDKDTIKNLKQTMEIFKNLKTVTYDKNPPINGKSAIPEILRTGNVIASSLGAGVGGMVAGPVGAAVGLLIPPALNKLKDMATVKMLNTPAYAKMLVKTVNNNPKSIKYQENAAKLAAMITGNEAADNKTTTKKENK